jgi:hypothetical protein
VWVVALCDAPVPPQAARAVAAAMQMKSARPMDPLLLSIDAFALRVQNDGGVNRRGRLT